MARTALFSRLRRLCAAARRDLLVAAGSDRDAGVAVSRRAFGRAALAGAALVSTGTGSGCGDDGASADAGTGTSTSGGGDSTATSTSTGADTQTSGVDTTGGATGVRVAVIGGGMAGLHCAHRLAQAGVDVTVYEASDRAGGRMWTARGMFPGDQIAELGGEFIDSTHQTMFDLADEFGIALDDREMLLGDVTRDTWWIDGVAVPEATVVEQFSAIAPTIVQMVEMADSDDTAFAELDATSLAQWLTDNVPPTMYPELHAILTAAYRGEYGREPEEQSSLNLLYLIGADDPDPFRIFGSSDERYHTHLGNDTFVAALADALGERVTTGARLVAARDGEGGSTVLTFEGTVAGEVEADHVVFALPFTRLRQLDLADLGLSQDKREIIAQLGYGTNAKVIGAFTERVWQTQHDASGSITTDLPLQQTWDSAVGQDGAGGVLTNFLGGDQGVASGEGTPEAWFTGTVVDDLDGIFAGAAAAYVADSAIRMHWPTQEQTLGSYGCYLPGQWSFYGREGEREGNLHFCGEHTSLEFQGYMEGAAETGALVAMAILEDLGLALSTTHRRMCERKLVRQHPAIHGRLDERPRYRDRHRALVARARQLG